MRSRWWFAGWFAAMLSFALVAAACGGDEGGGGGGGGGGVGGDGDQPGEGHRVAFVYDGTIDDGGWNEGHDAGRQYLIQNLPGVETTTVEEIAPGDQAQATFEDLATEGYDLIIGTTFYHDDVFAVAPDFPDTKFVSWAGYETAENIGAYDLATEDGRYLDGIVAGSMTKTNIIGYPAGFPIEEVVRGINAFTLGAQTVNSDVKVIPVWINSWYDPPKERQASESLVDAGADVLVGEVNSPAMQSVAEKRGVYAIGYGWDQSSRSPNVWLSSFTFQWGPYYLSQAQAILDGVWQPEIFYGGLADGGIGLSPFGPDVPQDVIDLVEQKREEIANGTFDIFAGPIYDNEGNIAVPDGETIPFDERTTCCKWLAEGVEGTVPQ
ncbi:MAG: BMP family ABC transporter substrate-binding protein [Actinomycetota bacterium]